MNRKEIIEVVRALDGDIGRARISENLLGLVNVLLIVAVIQQADDAAAHALQTLMDLGKIGELFYAVGAAGFPHVQHGDPVCGKQIRAVDRVAVQVPGLEAYHLAGHLRMGSLGLVIVRALDDVFGIIQKRKVFVELIVGKVRLDLVRTDDDIVGVITDGCQLIPANGREHIEKVRAREHGLVTVAAQANEGEIGGVVLVIILFSAAHILDLRIVDAGIVGQFFRYPYHQFAEGVFPGEVLPGDVKRDSGLRHGDITELLTVGESGGAQRCQHQHREQDCKHFFHFCFSFQDTVFSII